MPDYTRFGLMSAGFSQSEPQGFVADLRKLVRHAKSEVEELEGLEEKYSSIGLKTPVSRGSMPRNKWAKTSSAKKMHKASQIAPRLNELRNYNLGAAPRAELVRRLAEWTRDPFRPLPYQSVCAHLPGAGDSELAQIAQEIMVNGNGEVLQYAAGSGCWTFNFPPARRAIAEQALIDAQIMATRTLRLLNEYEGLLVNAFDDYFGDGTYFSHPERLNTIKRNFTAIHANIAGANRSKLYAAAPAGHMNPPGNRTVAFVLENTYRAQNGAVLFLHDPFFNPMRPAADRAATIIHEASHYFAGTVDEDETGTDDGCYGVDNCKRMAALGTPAALRAALRNADTYSNFAMEVTNDFEFFLT